MCPSRGPSLSGNPAEQRRSRSSQPYLPGRSCSAVFSYFARLRYAVLRTRSPPYVGARFLHAHTWPNSSLLFPSTKPSPSRDRYLEFAKYLVLLIRSLDSSRVHDVTALDGKLPALYFQLCAIIQLVSFRNAKLSF